LSAQARQRRHPAHNPENPNARISENGFARVFMGLDGDASLAQIVAAPADLRPWLNDT
jgi:hypothetical protein